VFDPITGDNGAGPIAAMLAMDENWRSCCFNNRKYFGDFCVSGPAKASQRQIDANNSVGICLILLRFQCILGHSQIDDHLDAEPLEILYAKFIGLGAAIKALIYPAKIDDAFAGRQTALSAEAEGRDQ
jgi:hypothetical protein